MLYSAQGLTLPPSEKAPPISTTRSSRRGEARLPGEREGEIGQRRETAHRHRPLRPRHDKIDDRVGGEARGGLQLGLRQLVALEAILAVDVFGRLQRAAQRPRRAGVDRRLAASDQFERFERVLGGQRERRVAADRGDRQEIELAGRAERHQESDGVVGRRIGVDDDRTRHACLEGRRRVEGVRRTQWLFAPTRKPLAHGDESDHRTAGDHRFSAATAPVAGDETDQAVRVDAGNDADMRRPAPAAATNAVDFAFNISLRSEDKQTRVRAIRSVWSCSVGSTIVAIALL